MDTETQVALLVAMMFFNGFMLGGFFVARLWNKADPADDAQD